VEALRVARAPTILGRFEFGCHQQSGSRWTMMIGISSGNPFAISGTSAKSQTSNVKSQISNLKSQISNLKSQFSILNSQFSILNSQFSNFGFQKSDLRILETQKPAF
jgi:hypothetical protein